MMKKLLSLLVIVCMTVFCQSCHKDDNSKNNGNNSSQGTEDPSGGDDGGYDEGVFQPSKKISSVTNTVTTHLDNGSIISTTTTSTYNWEDNKLKRINSNGSSNDAYNVEIVIEFTYENNRLARIDYFSNMYGNSYVECQYVNNKLSMSNAYKDGQLCATQTYTYTGGRITKIEESYLNDRFCDFEKDLYEMLSIPGMDLIKYAGDAFPKNHPKTGSMSTIMLTWSNGNVTRVEATNNENPSMRYTVEAEYDTYINPFYGYFIAQIVASNSMYTAISTSLNEWCATSINYSKNNVTRMTFTNPSFVMEAQYSYTYEGAYRKTATYTANRSDNDNLEMSGYSEFEYLN